MASILDRYGIKEVADCVFYEIGDNGEAGAPVLFLDTLKVSTIEQTAENTSARGGKGNPKLITWDFNKEINVTLEDAVFSTKSMALMYGVDLADADRFGTEDTILKTVKPSAVTEGGKIKIGSQEFTVDGEIAYYDEKGATTEKASAAYATAKIKVDGQKIVISGDKFPGTYYFTGDTYRRSEKTGEDEFFQFIMPKVKMLSEVTLTMEAEGDPSTFNMNLEVMRPDSGDMMKLVSYSLPESDG